MRSEEKLQPFVPGDALERAVHQGDLEATLASLRGLTPVERKARAGSLEAMGRIMRASHWQGSPYAREWGGEAQTAQYRAFHAATVVCMAPKDFLDHLGPQVALDAPTVEALFAQFGIDAPGWRAALRQAAQAQLQAFAGHILPVQNLVAARLVDRPQGDDYAIGLMALPRALPRATTMGAMFDSDPGLYQATLRLFDVEGTGEHNLSAVDKYNHSPQNAWPCIFMAGIERGEFTRAQLLDKTLGTLERDWPQFRAGWFSRFHETLAPTADEMAPFAPRYLGLCQSRIPPTVTLALSALKVLHAAGHADGASLLGALQPAFHAGAKSQVDAALKLAEAAVKREPALAHAASAVALNGLVHEAADLQKKILERLKAWGLDDAARAELAAHAQGVATVNRPALLALTGDAGAATRAPAAGQFSPPPEAVDAVGDGPLDPLDASRALAPVGDAAELVERIAFVLENPRDIDELERVLEALVRTAPLPATQLKQFAPVMKRARKLMQGEVQGQLARLLAFVVGGERDEASASNTHKEPQAAEFLALRVQDLVAQAAQYTGLAPLASATHARGFIDAAVFIERIAAHQALGVQAPSGEQVRGLLRLAPPGKHAAALRGKAGALADAPLVRALRHALGEDGIAIDVKAEEEQALFAAAARIRHPGADDGAVSKALGDLGPDGPVALRCEWRVEPRSWTVDGNTYTHRDLRLSGTEVPASTPLSWVAVRLAGVEGAHDEALLRYLATVLPSSLESFFADGCRHIGGNLDWWEAQWQNRAYLEPLLDPTVPITARQPMAVLLLALSLAGKEPGQAALAVDALVQSFTEGRLDVPALGAQLRALLPTSIVMARRYGKSLQAAVRADARLAAPVFDLLCDMLAADEDHPPKDLAALLELLLELALSSRRALPAPAQAALARLALTGKGRVAQKNLLALA